MGKTKDKPTAAVETLKPYVKRAMEDPELRDDLVAAFVTARSLYEQIGKKDGVKEKAKRVSDKDFQEDIQDLVADLTTASERLQGKSSKKSHKLRNRVVLLTGVTLGVLYNPWTGPATREWIMDQVSGTQRRRVQGVHGRRRDRCGRDGRRRRRRRGEGQGRREELGLATSAFVPGRARARPGRGRRATRCPPPGADRPRGAGAWARRVPAPEGT